MRYIIFIFALATCMSCEQSNTKEKELELKERELALKEKELALKQNDTVNKHTTIAVSPTTDTKVDPHSDFNTFWVDFKQAVNNGDKDAVIKMTNLPFKDAYREKLQMLQGTGKPRTSNSIDEFKLNYNKIFTAKVISAINSNGYFGWEKRNKLGNSSSVFKKGQYFLIYENEEEGLLFSKVNGVYKLLSIPHYDMTLDGD